jgi:hypothetical protein
MDRLCQKIPKPRVAVLGTANLVVLANPTVWRMAEMGRLWQRTRVREVVEWVTLVDDQLLLSALDRPRIRIRAIQLQVLLLWASV